MAGNNPQAKKELSPIIKAVLEHNPDDLAKWRESCGVSEESFGNLANKRRDDVNNLMKVVKAFPVAALTLINLVGADTDAGLSSSDLDSLKSDVFSKTAEAIAKVEKKKAEDAEAKAKADKKKKQEEEEAKEAERTKNEIHTADQFLLAIPNTAWQATARKRLIAFFTCLTPKERQNFSRGLKGGNQKSKFAAIVGLDKPKDQKALAQANGWI